MNFNFKSDYWYNPNKPLFSNIHAHFPINQQNIKCSNQYKEFIIKLSSPAQGEFASISGYFHLISLKEREIVGEVSPEV